MTLKERILSGQKVAGTMLRMVKNPAVCYLARNAGLDFLMFDCEHSDYSFETLHDVFAVGKALELPLFVRVPTGSKEYISRMLDAGATGIMVPTTENAGEAKTIVEHSRYSPVGSRSFTAGWAHTDYKPAAFSEVSQYCGKNVVSIAQIETAAGVDNAGDIAAVEGIDVLFIGPNDLSVSLGIPGDIMNPKELDAIAKVAASCKKHGKAFGLFGGAALLEKFKGDFTFMMSAFDVDILTQGFREIAKIRDKFNN